MQDMSKSGFVNIVGRPNVGKSTLMNALVGERMSIITPKPQTTRHRILGIVSGEGYQVIFSDTPGVIENPSYKMQEIMNRFVHSSFEDADLILFMTNPAEKYTDDDPLLAKLKLIETPLFLVINKIDLSSPEELAPFILEWNKRVKFTETIPISALNRQNTDRLFQVILDHLNEGPMYFPEDQLTDRSERFFVSEIIREKVLLLYKQEIPYSAQVIVDSFKEGQTQKGEPLTRIGATIFVDRKSQKPIIIGKGGSAIKRLGMEARKTIESFLETKVFLELSVKVKENWRDDEQLLNHFGYQ